MKAHFKKYILDFKRPSGTSRGVLIEKETWFLRLQQEDKIGIGECSLLRGLSHDDVPGYEEKLAWLCRETEKGLPNLLEQLTEFPSIRFGYEMALKSLASDTPFELFPSKFTKGKASIPINGLIWMGEKDFMKTQIEQKFFSGFRCIKLKIGALDFKKELELLRFIRDQFAADVLELRVDANGAFTSDDALDKLHQLHQFDLHSIEQPIKPGSWKEMADLCRQSPFAIALDEELIGVFGKANKMELLESIHPHYLILKPSLLGGFAATQEWITLAQEMNIGWWVTSALESNVGLNAIAQWTFQQKNSLRQGLGTGSLYTNNIESPLEIKGEDLAYNPRHSWHFEKIKFD